MRFAENNVGPLPVHKSRNLCYRKPFGAVMCGSKVYLAIDVPPHFTPPILCYAYGLMNMSYHEQPMEKDESKEGRFFTRIRMPSEPCLFFYWFKLASSGDKKQGIAHISYYVRSTKDLAGGGEINRCPARISADEERNPSAFQITVFKQDLQTPDWMKGALIYQVFPDRFARDTEFSYPKMVQQNVYAERILHDSWDEDVDIEGKPETGYIACDFYGGSLKGIAEKAHYLKNLNVELLYLNPIFTARSNHRYDTGHYMETDPLLGGADGFSFFNQTMKESGIRYMLDGVFSHTGADSLYFNKYGRYDEKGAFQAWKEGGMSRYSSWYTFSNDKTKATPYDSWWGFPELPNVNENDLSYREYICGEEGVLAYWIKKGASGFRLDVSDELPDSFIREIHDCVVAHTDGQGVVMGEIWEDASNKVSYGAYRDFILGRTHHSVMGYPFREAVLGFLGGTLSAEQADHMLETIREHYPPHIHVCCMNLLSSHDIPRAITVLCGEKDPGDRIAQQNIYLDADQRAMGMKLMRLGFIFQMGYIGCPSIYYGDEIGMEGYRDPFNRRTYPWGDVRQESQSLLTFYQQASTLRKMFPVLRTGAYRTIYAEDDLFVFERTLDAGKDLFDKKQTGAQRLVFMLNRNKDSMRSVHLSDMNSLSHIEELCFGEESETLDEFVYRTMIRLEEEPIPVPPLGFRIFIFDYFSATSSNIQGGDQP